MRKYLHIFFAVFIIISCEPNAQVIDFKFGADVLLEEKIDLIEGKNIGIVTNKTAVMSSGELLLDTLLERSDIVNIVAIFSPEHGFELDLPAGESVPETKLGNEIKIFSLYGNTKKPTDAMLNNIDVLVFDIQDIGARFYTYISTLYYVIESAAENNIPLVVLDRPNPLGGLYVDGPVLEEQFISFVGITKIPVVHGMTIGELALMFNNILSREGKRADLTIVRMKGWDRSYTWDDLDINWINPSPNIVNFKTAVVYPATCFLEGTNISEGRGTYTPFTVFGAPFINEEKLKSELGNFTSDNIVLRSVEFVPADIAGKAVNPKYNGEICRGIFIEVINPKEFEPVKFGVKILYFLHKLYPDKFEMNDYFDTLWGTDTVRKQILAGKTPEEIYSSWEDQLNLFRQYREQFLLY